MTDYDDDMGEAVKAAVYEALQQELQALYARTFEMERRTLEIGRQIDALDNDDWGDE